jgi:hypothetical protein
MRRQAAARSLSCIGAACCFYEKAHVVKADVAAYWGCIGTEGGEKDAAHGQASIRTRRHVAGVQVGSVLAVVLPGPELRSHH